MRLCTLKLKNKKEFIFFERESSCFISDALIIEEVAFNIIIFIILSETDNVECECPLTMASIPRTRQEEPGQEQPWAVNPNDRPPCYLPQPEDKIPSNKEDGMGPVGPWATGRVDWGPLKGLTGTRPVVDRYSIARYSEGEWRQHNRDILEGKGERAVHRNNL